MGRGEAAYLRPAVAAAARQLRLHITVQDGGEAAAAPTAHR